LKDQEQLEKLLSLSGEKRFSIRINENLHKRFNQHIKCLKNINRRLVTKQNWIVDAFQEKLAHQDDSFSGILNEKLIHFKVDEKLFNELDSKVEMIKKFRSFSKKQWMIEAIYEKLEREEQKVKKELQDKINSLL